MRVFRLSNTMNSCALPSRVSSASIRCDCDSGMSSSALPCMISTGASILSTQRNAERVRYSSSRLFSYSGQMTLKNLA